MPKYTVTYMAEPSGAPETEPIEADMVSEGYNFVIFSRLSGAQPHPFLRINAASVLRVEEDA